MILDGIRKRWPRMRHLFTDDACDRTGLMDKAAFLDFVIAIVRRSDRQSGWTILWRRLIRDYEKRLDVSEAMTPVAMGNPLPRRIVHR